jgi:oxygen-independent coproporphyrinogen-3 oxidase
MEQGISTTPLSLYIHIPFCLSRCGYCSFFSLPYSNSALEQYLVALHKELQLYRSYLNKPLASIYFGGGSPSLLSNNQINGILNQLTWTEDAEISIEINPIQITAQFLDKLKQSPVNRLSIGLQSMDNSQLKWLDRRHLAEDMPNRMELCRKAGFDNISLDFMYGLPNSDITALGKNLEAYIKLNPEHISAYLLCLEEGSSRYGEKDSLPDEDTVEEEYNLICESLAASGYIQYEISNFAKPGRESRHNLAYWHSDSYLALGASASGWMPPIRYQNHDDMGRYYDSVEQGLRFPNGENCDAQRQEEDFLMMGLRLLKGIDLKVYRQRFGRDLLDVYKEQINKLTGIGMLELEGNHLRISRAGLFVSNSVIAELIL